MRQVRATLSDATCNINVSDEAPEVVHQAEADLHRTVEAELVPNVQPVVVSPQSKPQNTDLVDMLRLVLN